MKKTILILIFLSTSLYAFASEDVFFAGIPKIKISEGGIERLPEEILRDKAMEYKCIITKTDDKYYWTTRQNLELTPISAGAFITFFALNGSGYIRIVNPEMKEAASIMGGTEKEFDYVEHLLIGLKSITYYGKSEN